MINEYEQWTPIRMNHVRNCTHKKRAHNNE